MFLIKNENNTITRCRVDVVLSEGQRFVRNEPVYEHGDHERGRDEAPTGAPVERGLDAQHELYVQAQAFHTYKDKFVLYLLK